MAGQKPTSAPSIAIPIGLVISLIVAGFGVVWHLSERESKAWGQRFDKFDVWRDQHQDEVIQIQRNIDRTLLELQHNRQKLENHCNNDKILDAADVREVLRE